MLRAYKVEIKPNQEQINTINQTIGTCRWVYNKFIEANQLRYKNNLKYMKCNNCGNKEDRDINASINLKQAKEYTILV